MKNLEEISSTKKMENIFQDIDSVFKEEKMKIKNSKKSVAELSDLIPGNIRATIVKGAEVAKNNKYSRLERLYVNALAGYQSLMPMLLTFDSIALYEYLAHML